MSMTDPIADMLTRIRNAIQASHDELTIPSSRMKCEISKILKGEGFIDDFDVEDDDKQGKLRIRLRYGPEGERVITGIERVSRPGRRVYVGSREIPGVLGGMGITILSTSKGVVEGRTARRLNVGGEWLCNVW